MKSTDVVRLIRPGYFLRTPEGGVHDLNEYVTSDDKLFVVTHMATIEVDAGTWTMQVDGLVHNPRSFTLEQILALPQHDVISVHECAGSPLTPKVAKRRVGNVIWTGPRLADVLAICAARATASYVWSEGLEWGEFAGIRDHPYIKDLPLEKALSPEVILAVAMNGRPLRAERGGPVRLVVPGWYGTNSVKWVGRITVANTRSPGPYTTRFYNDSTPEGPRPVWGIAPECVIVSPAHGTLVSAGSEISIEGWAWAENGVKQVEISVDDQRTWIGASLAARRDFGWQPFRLPWTFGMGAHRVSCRCVDANGMGQPSESARNEIHSIVVTGVV